MTSPILKACISVLGSPSRRTANRELKTTEMDPLSVLRPKAEIQVQAGCTPAGGSRRGPSCLSQHLGPQVPSDLQPCPSRLSHSLSCHQPLDLRTTSFTFTTSADPERQVGMEPPGWASTVGIRGLVWHGSGASLLTSGCPPACAEST